MFSLWIYNRKSIWCLISTKSMMWFNCRGLAFYVNFYIHYFERENFKSDYTKILVVIHWWSLIPAFVITRSQKELSFFFSEWSFAALCRTAIWSIFGFGGLQLTLVDLEKDSGPDLINTWIGAHQEISGVQAELGNWKKHSRIKQWQTHLYCCQRNYVTL